MNLTSASRTFQLLKRAFDTRTPTESFLPPSGEKKSLPIAPVPLSLPRCQPEVEGISSDHIRLFLEELARGSDLYIQNAMILRHGKVLCSASFGGQNLSVPKYTFSVCKSVTSLAIGLLVGDGALQLQDTLGELLEEASPSTVSKKMRSITVENLLTMRTGVQYSEADSLTESDWVRGYLSAAIRGEPGTEFQYNSLNTYMLSVIVCRLTGTSMTEFLRKRLFGPLGIENIWWETCPSGYEKGGWGLYICPEDLAKLGILVMNGGQWQGRQLIDKDYLRAATTAHAVPSPALGDFNYGYQMWVGRHENTFLFNGMLGQNMLCFRDSGIIVVTNAGADTDYQESRYFEIVSRYFGGSFPHTLPAATAAQSRLAETVASLSSYNRAPEALAGRGQPFMHRTFSAADPKAAAVGLLPVALQVLHNNYSAGLLSVAVSERGGLPELIWREQDALYRLPVGLGRPAVSQLSFRGDHYHIAALGRFTHDEEERDVFYIRLEFLETPCVRIIKLLATPEGILLRLGETPGIPYITKHLAAAAEQPLYRPLLLVGLGGSEEDFLHYKAQQLLAPEITMTAAN